MNQRAALRDMDAVIVGAFMDVGMADAATYVAPGGGAPLPCSVLVDRAAQFFGENGAVAGTRVAITLFLSEVATPEQDGTLTLTATSEAFKLDEIDAQDESMSRWVVVNG